MFPRKQVVVVTQSGLFPNTASVCGNRDVQPPPAGNRQETNPVQNERWYHLHRTRFAHTISCLGKLEPEPIAHVSNSELRWKIKSKKLNFRFRFQHRTMQSQKAVDHKTSQFERISWRIWFELRRDDCTGCNLIWVPRNTFPKMHRHCRPEQSPFSTNPAKKDRFV